MNPLHLIKSVALHIYSARKLLVWNILACFIYASCSMQVKNGAIKDGTTNNKNDKTRMNILSNEQIQARYWKEYWEAIENTTSIDKRNFILRRIPETINLDQNKWLIDITVNDKKQTATHIAAKIGLATMFWFLFTRSRDIHQDENGNTPFHLGLLNIRVLEMLVKQIEYSGDTPTSIEALDKLENLLYCFKNNKAETPFQLLIEKTKNPSTNDPDIELYKQYSVRLQKRLRSEMLDTWIQDKLVEIQYGKDKDLGIENENDKRIQIKDCNHQFNPNNFNAIVLEYQENPKKQEFFCLICNQKLHTKKLASN